MCVYAEYRALASSVVYVSLVVKEIDTYLSIGAYVFLFYLTTGKETIRHQY